MPSEGGHAAAERDALLRRPCGGPAARTSSQDLQPRRWGSAGLRRPSTRIRGKGWSAKVGSSSGPSPPPAPSGSSQVPAPRSLSSAGTQRPSRTEQTATGHSSVLGPCLYFVWHSALGGVKIPGTPLPGAGNPAGAGTAERWPSRQGVEPRSSPGGLIAGAPPCPSFTDPVRVNRQVSRYTSSTDDPRDCTAGHCAPCSPGHASGLEWAAEGRAGTARSSGLALRARCRVPARRLRAAVAFCPSRASPNVALGPALLLPPAQGQRGAQGS